MEEISVAFDVLEDGKRPFTAHKRIFFHLIYDIKMDFTRKARLVAEGCITPNPMTSTYVGVVYRESVRISFTYAALTGFDVWTVDVNNVFLQASYSEKYYQVCRPEFESKFAGKIVIIIRAAYGSSRHEQIFATTCVTEWTT